MDPEDPTCWRLSLTGRVAQVEEGQRSYAEHVVFSKYELRHKRESVCVAAAHSGLYCVVHLYRHPQMKHWPKNHGFSFYVLEIEHLVFLDFYGAAKHIPVSDYYKVKL